MSKVYFVRATSVNLIKIGRSSDPERRLQELRLISPVPLSLIGTVDGGSATEAAFHERFRHLRSHGEWFHATKELLTEVLSLSLRSIWDNAHPDAREKFLQDIGAIIDTPVMDRGVA